MSPKTMRTDVASESAGVALVKGDPSGIVKAVQLNRATMKDNRQNLFFASIYNVLGVPVAAGVLVPLFGMGALLNAVNDATAMPQLHEQGQLHSLLIRAD